MSVHGSPASAITCPWCRHYWPSRSDVRCGECGGALPAPPGEDPGASPAPPPRQLPEKYKKNILLWKNTMALVGLTFMGIGVPLIAAFGAGLIFVIIGYFVYRKGRTSGEQRLRALSEGVAGSGQIVRVSENTSLTVNGRHPIRIEYSFDAPSGKISGEISVWDATCLQRRPGEPVWVVYVSSDPSINSLWPPLV